MQKTQSQKNAQRGKTLRWLRKIHGWLGLWGALLGLLFGMSGFLLNHRAVMKIPAVQIEASEIQLPMVAPYPENDKAFTQYIQTTLNIHHEPVKPKGEAKPKSEAKPTAEHSDKPTLSRQEAQSSKATFLDKTIEQPKTLKVSFQLPQARIDAEYVMGNQYALIKREDANVWGFITRMHKGVGANAAWVLLADSIAGALLILSITGVLLWTKMRQSRLAMAGLIGGSTLLTIWITLLMM